MFEGQESCWTRGPNRPAASCVGSQTSATHRETPWGLRVPLRASLAETAGRTDNQLVASLPEHLSELKLRVNGTKTAAHDA